MSNHVKVPSMFFDFHPREQSPEEKRGAPSTSSPSNIDNRKKTLPKKKLECYRCKGPHKVVSCPNKKLECYRCKGPHKVVSCPNKKLECYPSPHKVVSSPNKELECYRYKGPHKMVNCPKKKLECYLCNGPHKLVNCPTKKAINKLLTGELKSQDELIGGALTAKRTVEGIDLVKESMVDKETLKGIDSVKESMVDKETVKGIDSEGINSVKESMVDKEIDSVKESMVNKETVVGIDSVKESMVECILKKLKEAVAWVKTEVKALVKLLSESLVNGLLGVESFVINCCQKFKQVLASINRQIESGVVTLSEPISDKKPESFPLVKRSNIEAENLMVKELGDVLEKQLQKIRDYLGFHAEISIWVNLVVGYKQLLEYSIAQRGKLIVSFVIGLLDYLRKRKQATGNIYTKKYECRRGQEAVFAVSYSFDLVLSAFFG